VLPRAPLSPCIVQAGPTTAQQPAEKFIGSGKKCQGATSVVPQAPQDECGALQDAEKLPYMTTSEAL
jgi:hypothetical protein